MPDKAVDLIDEAAARLRLDVESLPPELTAQDQRIRDLLEQEESAAQRSDYEGGGRASRWSASAWRRNSNRGAE